MMTMILSSCGSCTKEKVTIPELKQLEKKRFNKPDLNCLGKDLKVVVIDRIMNCEERLITVEDQIKAFNKK